MEKNQKAAETFAAILEENPNERAALLAEKCGADTALRNEVEELLAAHERAESNEFLRGSALENAAESLAEDKETDFRAGQNFGHYRIIRRIGAGGMGAIYLAERDDDYEKQVAVKIIKRGMDTDAILQRFRNERQILANLEHPNIARLFDGGTTDDGLPFFVMEYIEGLPIDQYCRRENLSETGRLKIFRQVCAAVSFAHQNLIVHRDLKPSNILVTKSGEPKLLDFGIAKLLNSSDNTTVTEARVLTPAYASPEQMRGEMISTSSDVFSLGVIFRELLTAQRPDTLVEIERWKSKDAARSKKRTDQNARNLTAQTADLTGDLQIIAATAQREDAARRYASVEALSEDVRRYLAGLPIAARKDSAAYRTAKFVQRNRLAVAVAVLFVLSLIGGLAATVWQWRIARHERALAQERFETLRKSSSSMINEINGALIDLPSSLPARKLLLDRAMEQLDVLAASSENNPQLQNDLGDAYQNLNYLPDKTLDERIALLEKSIGFYEKTVAIDAKNAKARKGLAIDNVNLADIARMKGDIPNAAEHNRRAVELLESVIADEPDDVESQTDLWNVYYNAALTFNQQGRAADSLEICRRMTPLADKLAKENPVDLSGNEFRRPYLDHGLASANLIYLGRYDEALNEINTAIEANKEQLAKHSDSLYARLDESVFKERLAKILERKGNREEALKMMRESLEISEKLAAENTKDNYYLGIAASTRTRLAQMLDRAGKFDEAISYFQKAIKTDEEILEKDAAQKQAKFSLAASYGGLGDALARLGKTDQGLAKEQKALEIYNEINVPSSADSILRHDFAEVAAQTAENFLLKKSDAVQAQNLFRQSYDVLEPMKEQQILSAIDVELLEKVSNRLKS